VAGTSFLVLRYNTPTTITNFAGATGGQTVRVLGNSNVTIANNANIFTRSGASTVLAANQVYEFTYYNKAWFQSAA
jgi:hypothetical protein